MSTHAILPLCFGASGVDDEVDDGNVPLSMDRLSFFPIGRIEMRRRVYYTIVV